MNVKCKLVGSHMFAGDMTSGEEIAIIIDQTLTQDVTGTLIPRLTEEEG